jgi:hypothetical protein
MPTRGRQQAVTSIANLATKRLYWAGQIGEDSLAVSM